MNYFTYILECADESFYVGCTNDLERRLKQHNDSKWGAHYTKIRRPVVLKYKESYPTLTEARRRESEIKGWCRDKKLELMEHPRFRGVRNSKSGSQPVRRSRRVV